MSDEKTVAVRSPLQFEAATFDDLFRMAKALSPSALLPASLRGKPEDLAIVLMQGREMGLAPMQSIRGIHVIQGRATMAADLLSGLVLKSEKCEYLTLLETSNAKATYETKRKGAPLPVKMTYTFDDAKAAGLTGKDNYRTNPAAMLRARCSAAICRAVYPDVVYGMYATEEIGPEGREPVDAPAAQVVELVPPKAGRTPRSLAELKAQAVEAKVVPAAPVTAAETLAADEAPAGPSPWDSIGEKLAEQGATEADALKLYAQESGKEVPGTVAELPEEDAKALLALLSS